MQYILTEEEYNSLVDKRSTDDKKLVARLQEACTIIADTQVITKGWAKGRVWGCVLSTYEEHYCDECPAEHLCPLENKAWSK